MWKQIQSFFSKDSRSGQSLIEVIVGLAIGAILMGASAFAIAGMIQTNNTSQKWRSATALAQGLLTNARAYGTVNWQNLYGLSKGSSFDYFLNASGTTYNVIWGKEGMLDNDVTSGLVGEWKFDEDVATTSTLTYDATGNGDDGTLVNSPTRATSTCKIANCLIFNGSSTYVVAPFTAFGIGKPFSFAVWFKTTSTFAYEPGIISLGYSPVIVMKTDGKVRVWWYDGTTWPTIASVKSYNDGNFHFVTATYDGITVKLYMDGVFIASAVSNINSIYSGFDVGREFNSGNKIFNGFIDDARVYNRALSAYEVGQLYNSNVFRRYFYVENACRTNDASSSISGVSPCAVGSADDPSTQKISAITEWTTPTGANPQVLLSDYVTRWKNSVFQQNDWSGGPNATGVTINPTNLFSSSTNVNFSGKSLRIQGL